MGAGECDGGVSVVLAAGGGISGDPVVSVVAGVIFFVSLAVVWVVKRR